MGRPTGTDILLGNSAAMANNHLEALEQLSLVDLSGRRVLVPLTYGSAAYRTAVVERGRQLLGDAFEPLVEPLPFARLPGAGRPVRRRADEPLPPTGPGQRRHRALHRRPRLPFAAQPALRVAPLGAGRARQIETAHALPTAPLTGVELEQRRARLAEIWGPDVVLANVRGLLAAAQAKRR